jgi:hypothetical protein
MLIGKQNETVISNLNRLIPHRKSIRAGLVLEIVCFTRGKQNTPSPSYLENKTKTLFYRIAGFQNSSIKFTVFFICTGKVGCLVPFKTIQTTTASENFPKNIRLGVSIASKSVICFQKLMFFLRVTKQRKIDNFKTLTQNRFDLFLLSNDKKITMNGFSFYQINLSCAILCWFSDARRFTNGSKI